MQLRLCLKRGNSNNRTIYAEGENFVEMYNDQRLLGMRESYISRRTNLHHTYIRLHLVIRDISSICTHPVASKEYLGRKYKR